MTATTRKRKTIVIQINVPGYQVFRPFDIRLPNNARKITGILVTARKVFVDAG